MRKSLLCIVMLCTCSFALHAQSTKESNPDEKKKSKSRLPAGYMGLWDMGFGVGYLNDKEHHTYTATDHENGTSNGMFLMAHIQESVLSNYVWATEPDKKIKIGITETLDIGGSYLYKKKTTTTSGNDLIEKSTGFGFLFTYEAGAGAVYKINNMMDAGLTYYGYVLSSFTPNHRYAKLRFRYNHLMCELSVLGKTSIDVKYLKGSITSRQHDRSSSTYFGFSIIPRNSSQNGNTPAFVYASMGIIF